MVNKYFISFVLQEPGMQDIFGNGSVSVSGKLKDYQEVQSKLEAYMKDKEGDIKNRKLIILNIVKL